MGNEVRHYDIKVFGKVQGVFYRAKTSEVANELNIKGKVRNEKDGSVYIEAEGPQDKLNRFIEWCQQGPKDAEVERIETSEKGIVGFDSFTVVRN
jgi:acylphosphatase